MKKTILLFLLLIASLTPASAQTEADADTSAVSEKKKKPKVKISGLLQVHFIHKFDTNGDGVSDPDGFRILRARLEASGDINEFISYEVMIDPRAPEQRGLLRDAFIAFKLGKRQTLRVGQQKTQFGYENRETIREQYVVNRTEVSDGLSRGVNLRDAGLGLLGHVPLRDSFRLENAVTFTNGNGLNVAGSGDFQETKNWFGRLGIRYRSNDFTARLGVSGAKGAMLENDIDPYDPANDYYIKFKRLGFDVQVEHPRFSAVAEYVRGTDRVEGTEDESSFGYYLTLAGKTKWDIGPLLRFDALDDEFKRVTAGAYYGAPKDKFRVLLNYEFRGGIKDVPEGHDDRVYLQMQVVF